MVRRSVPLANALTASSNFLCVISVCSLFLCSRVRECVFALDHCCDELLQSKRALTSLVMFFPVAADPRRLPVGLRSGCLPSLAPRAD
jgi:hypothetical protein